MAWLRSRELGVRRGMAEVSILVGSLLRPESADHWPGRRFGILDLRFVGKGRRRRLRTVGGMGVVAQVRRLQAVVVPAKRFLLVHLFLSSDT